MNRPLHLAIFIRSLGGGGGAERMMVTLAEWLAGAGHRVDLVLGRREGHFVEEVPSAVRVVELGGGAWLPTLGLALRDPGSALRLLRPGVPWIVACAPALVRYLRAERPDAMLAALNFTNLTALWARRLAGVPTRLVVSERNTLSVRAARGARRLRRLPRLARHFYPWADALGAVSDGVAEDLAAVLGIPRERICTTWNPVVTPDVERRAAQAVDHPWFRPGEPPVVLGAGKLKRQKGFATLLEAFALLRARRSARLVILGEGAERSGLEALAARLGVAADVSLPGFVANPFAYMARSAVFALSSEWEGLPGVLIQALACGCPVVSTDCPSGPAEVLEGGAVGPLVPVGDAAALARALEATLDAPPSPERLRRRAALYSVERSASRYLALLAG